MLVPGCEGDGTVGGRLRLTNSAAAFAMMSPTLLEAVEKSCAQTIGAYFCLLIQRGLKGLGYVLGSGTLCLQIRGLGLVLTFCVKFDEGLGGLDVD